MKSIEVCKSASSIPEYNKRRLLIVTEPFSELYDYRAQHSRPDLRVNDIKILHKNPDYLTTDKSETLLACHNNPLISQA